MPFFRQTEVSDAISSDCAVSDATVRRDAQGNSQTVTTAQKARYLNGS